MNEKRNTEDLLRLHQLKVTGKRVALIEMIESVGEPVSAENLYRRLRETERGINMSSVYRNLELLSASGILVRTADYEVRRALYQLAKNAHHHAIICLGCNLSIPIEECPIEAFQNKYSKMNQFLIVSHRIELYGYCESCQSNLAGSGGQCVSCT